MTMVAAILFVACAGPAATPSPATTPAATNPPTASGTPGQSSVPSSTPGMSPSGSPEASPSGSPEASPSAAPTGTPYPDSVVAASEPNSITDSYPNYGDPIDCAAGTWNGRPYSGTVKSITATDDHTVVFTLCAGDVAFLSKVAFSVFGINDSDYLIQHAAAGDLKDGMNGTGPYKLDQWQRGSELDFSRFDGYWGDPAVAATAVLKWIIEPAGRLQELQAGTTMGITNVGPTDFATVSGDPNLQLLQQGGLNTLYLGMNHNFAPWDNLDVRKAIAIGIDRQRIVDQYEPPGSEVATHFTPCSIAFACTGDDWPDTNVETAKQMIDDATNGAGIDTTLSYRNVARGYLPLPIDVATDMKEQLAAIDVRVTLDEQLSGTFIGNANSGALEGLFLLGWGADYPDVTNFLDYHFGSGCTSAFGDCYPEIFDPLKTGASSSSDADREAAYTEANNAIIANVPMVPISHSGFANAYLAGVDGAQASPLSNELLFAMTPPDGGDQIVFTQNAEPIGLYCADETDGESLRACEQSMQSLYGFKINSSEVEPSLATSCDANDDLSVWTCHLRDGVTFHDGSTFEAKDVIASFAAQWDAASALHVGNTGTFEYWGGLWGGELNPPGPCGLANTDPCPVTP
ncbi:MAG: ABC transporter substrate-binding protein [Chloroflexota bacterium]